MVILEENKIAQIKSTSSLIDNQDVTLKHIKQINKNTVELIQQIKMKSKMYSIDRIEVQGVVIGQIRVY